MPQTLFFALPLSDDLKAALGGLPRPPLRASWARAEGLHLTLAFLGARPEGEQAILAALLEAFASGRQAFTLRTAELGGFPSLEWARVLWLGVAEEARLDALAGGLRARLEAAGLPFDSKPFAPHITLARMKAPSQLRGLLTPPAPQTFMAERIVLYRSLRLPEGARYEALAEARLGA